jgi:hypothetical protein
MKRALLGLFVGCMTLGLASVAFAGANADAGVSLHITNPPAKLTLCSEPPSFGGSGGKKIDTKGLPCFQGQTGEFDVWVLVCNGSDSVGVAGVEFGLEYDGATGSGVDVRRWTLCADLDFDSGNFPASGGGNAVTWISPENCQDTNAELHGGGKDDEGNQGGKLEVPNSVIAIAGVLRVNVWGSDVMEVIPRPVSGKLTVANCSAAEDDLTDAIVPRGGIAAFCSNFNGYNFCAKGALPAEQTTTWGNIKTLYKQ